MIYNKHNKSYMSIIIKQCKLIGVDVDDVAAEKLEKYVKLINRWNRSYNLTAVKDMNSLINKHIVDSLTLLPYIQDGSLVLDVGTGAGLPGIPLSIVNSSLKVHLLDSNSKKICFLRQAVADLKLNNIVLHNTRIEDFKTVEKYNFIVTRAFASLSIFYESVKHLMVKDTQLIAMKGIYPSAELEEINIECCVDKKDLPGDFASQRHIVTINKQGS